MKGRNQGTLTKRINIRLTAAENKRLENEAAKAGMSVSAYMRFRLRTAPKLISASDEKNVLELRSVGARFKRIFAALKQDELTPELERVYEEAMSELMEILKRISKGVDEKRRKEAEEAGGKRGGKNHPVPEEKTA